MCLLITLLCTEKARVTPVYKNEGENNDENNFRTTSVISHIAKMVKSLVSTRVVDIPAEFIKSCKTEVANDLIDVFNYLIEERDFPDRWTEGIRSAIHKGGPQRSVNNFRGITILPLMEKIFEIVVYNRLSFLNEALDKYDKWNGGYMKNVRTTDNLFILNGIVQKQLLIGKSLYVCFVDFSKPFDLVNRKILFYKLMRSSWRGRVVDTLRSLYPCKTKFRQKCSGMLSPAILNENGLNQGGVCSGLLFRKYVADLEQYLMPEMGICIGETIIGHLLWADDLILFSDTITGLQKQLDGVMKFCSHNRMIVNESKTKLMQFGKRKNLEVYFNGSKIDEVLEYKYLGVIIGAIRQANQDIFLRNYQYLCDQARKAIFCAQRTTKNIEPLTPEIYFYLFDSLVR